MCCLGTNKNIIMSSNFLAVKESLIDEVSLVQQTQLKLYLLCSNSSFACFSLFQTLNFFFAIHSLAMSRFLAHPSPSFTNYYVLTSSLSVFSILVATSLPLPLPSPSPSLSLSLSSLYLSLSPPPPISLPLSSLRSKSLSVINIFFPPKFCLLLFIPVLTFSFSIPPSACLGSAPPRASRHHCRFLAQELEERRNAHPCRALRASQVSWSK